MKPRRVPSRSTSPRPSVDPILPASRGTGLHRVAVALCLALLLLPALGAGLAAQESDPRLLIAKPIFDFGIVARGDVVVTEIDVENAGDAPLQILDAKSTCACAVPEYDRTIAPGETGKIKVTLDTIGLEGGQSRNIRIFTNDPENPQVDLTVRVESRPYIAAQPGFARYVVVQGFEREGVIPQRLFAPDGSDFVITGITSPNPALKVSFHEAEGNERDPRIAGKQWIVETNLSSDAPVGALSGYVKIATTHEKQKLVPIPVSGFVRPVFAVTPPEGGHTGTVPKAIQYHIKRFSEDPILLTGVETDVVGVTAELQDGGDGRTSFVTVRFTEDMPKGPYKGEVKILTSSDRAPFVTLPIEGEIR